MQGVLHTIVGDGRMALRQVPHGQGVDAEHVVHGGLVDVALDASLMGDIGRAFRRQMLIDVHEHRVHRVRGGLIQIDAAPVVLQSVIHLLIQAGEVLVGIAVEQRIEADAGLRGPQQSERLHSRTRFEQGLIGVVELLGQIIRTGVHGQYFTGLRVQRYAADLQGFRHVAQAGVADGLHEILLALVNGGDDLVSAGIQILFGKGLGLHQLTAHHIQQITVRPRVLVLLRHRGGLRELGISVLPGGDVTILLHDVQHTLEARFGHIGVIGWIPRGR